MAENSSELQAQISELKREIAELSALLALKKMENNHPALHRFAAEIESIGRSLARGRQRLGLAADEYLPQLRNNEAARFVGRVLVLSCINFALAWMFGWLREKKSDN
ncbi:MAG: hypothetical protein HDQ44_03310 [Desulfovibrio sp.]|nr:hypothetical protein [Desulfovibrio sp.]